MNQDLYGLQASGIDPEIAAQMLGLNSKKAITAALLKQSIQGIDQPQTPARGYTRRIHPLEAVADVLATYMGKKAMEGYDQQEGDLAKQNQAKVQDALAKYEQTRSGTPAIAPATPNDDEGNINPTVPGKAGDPRSAIAQALASPLLQNNPQVRADILSQQKAAEPFSLKQGEKRFVGGQVTASNEPKVAPMFKTIGLAGNKEQQFVSQDNGKTWTPEGQPTDKFNPAAGVRVNVPVNVSTEKKYAEQFASGMAKDDLALRDSAMRAPDLATRASRTLDLLNKGDLYTGTAANFKLGFDKALSATGLTDSSGKAINTEDLASSLAQNTLDHVKQSGLGSGNGFTDKDLRFLQDAQGGRITLEAGTIKRLAELSHRAAEQTAGKWNKRVKSIPKDALEGTGLDTTPVDVPSLGLPTQPGGKGQVLRFDAQGNPIP